MEPIQIRMFGEFIIKAGSTEISDAASRSRKGWSALAFLICNRKNTVSQKKLIDLLYGEEDDSANPENALRITMHRVRTNLDRLWPGAGKELLLYKPGGYCWNPQVQVTLDCEEFDDLCSRSYEDADTRLSHLLAALGFYQGEFLPRHSDESWVIPISAHFQNRFMEMTQEAAIALMERSRYSEAAALCRRGISSDPYHEGLHQQLMRALSAGGDMKGAAAVYDSLRKRLFDDFGIQPSSETREVYRATALSPKDRVLPMDEVVEQLREPAGKFGAMVCDYDHFKTLCYSESRTLERSGHATHIAIISAVSSTSVPLSKRSQERIMEQLGEHIRLNLRRSDTLSRCSLTQYIMLLPKANYENSCMVCRRIMAAFHHAHARTAVKLNYMVQPLTPGIQVP